MTEENRKFNLIPAEEFAEMLRAKRLAGIDFSGENLEGVDFSGCTLDRVSFKGCTLTHCRFRKAVILWSDFRYCEIQHGTFEEAVIDFCDFYRAFLDGVIIFNRCRISNTSLNKTYIGESALIRKDNLVGGKILQQDRKNYARFLMDWHLYGTGVRTNDVGANSSWDPSQALKGRWAEAEEIIKGFSALWTGKGFIADGNWAYVQGRRMGRRRMLRELTDPTFPLLRKVANIWHIITNIFSDLLFGYGESMFKMVMTYIITVFFFAWAFSSNIGILQYGQAVIISLKNMVGMDSEMIQGVSPLVDMLNVVQTTVGILLTGIFGFILGNKIRNQ